MKKKLIPLGIGGLILAGLFYWFEIRPSQIKHGCSWVAHHEDAVPERSAMTEKELQQKGMLENCSGYPEELPAPSRPGVIPSIFDSAWGKICRDNNQKKIDDYKQTILAKPARDWYEKSTDTEYKFCLRDKGL